MRGMVVRGRLGTAGLGAAERSMQAGAPFEPDP